MVAIRKASDKYPGVRINELKNGNIVYYINYRDENGKPTQKKVGVKTKQSNFTVKDAYDKLIEVKHKLTTGEELPKVIQKKSVRITFRNIFDEYLEWAKVNKKTWKHNDLLVYNKHLSYLANKEVKSLTTKDFEQLKQEKLESGLKPKTVQHILGTARHIINYAIKHDLIKNYNNPISNGKVRMPKVQNQKIGFLTKEQAQQLIARLEKYDSNRKLYQFTVLLLFTGARFSEVARLTWADINFDNKLIYFMESKDGNPRYIKMTDRVYEVLQELHTSKSNHLILSTPFGNHYEKMPKQWQNIVDDLIPNNKNATKDRITTHTLRHTHASWLAQSGVDILHIKEQLGHKKIETTMRYSHLIDDNRHTATEKIAF